MVSLAYAYPLLETEEPARLERLAVKLKWLSPTLLDSHFKVEPEAVRASKPLARGMYRDLLRRGSISRVQSYHDAREIAWHISEYGEAAFPEVVEFKERYGIEANNILHESVDWSEAYRQLNFGNYMKLWRLVTSRAFQPRLFPFVNTPSVQVKDIDVFPSKLHEPSSKEGFQLRLFFLDPLLYSKNPIVR